MAAARFHTLDSMPADCGEDDCGLQPEVAPRHPWRKSLLVLGVGAAGAALAVVGVGLAQDRGAAPRSANIFRALSQLDLAECITAANEKSKEWTADCRAALNAGREACGSDSDCTNLVYREYNFCLSARFRCRNAMGRECMLGEEKHWTELPDCERFVPAATTTTTFTTAFEMGTCLNTVHSESSQRSSVCTDLNNSVELECAGKKKAQDCKTEGYTEVNDCRDRVQACREASKAACDAGSYPDVRSIESCAEVEEAGPIEADPDFQLVAGGTYEFYTLASCPTGIFCNHGVDGKFDPTIVKEDEDMPSLIRLDPAAKADEYYLTQQFTCRYHGSQCGKTLTVTEDHCPQSWSHDDYQCLVATFEDQAESPDPFKAVPVEGKPDQFYFVNQAGCPDGPRCGWYLSMDQANSANKAPKVVIEHLPEEEVETYGRWRLVSRADEPQVPVEVVDGISYNFHTMHDCENSGICNHALYAASTDPMIMAGEFALPTTLKLKAGENEGEFLIQTTSDCWSSSPQVCNWGLGIGVLDQAGATAIEELTTSVLAFFVEENALPFKLQLAQGQKDMFSIRVSGGDHDNWRLGAMRDGRLALEKAAEDYLWRLEAEAMS